MCCWSVCYGYGVGTVSYLVMGCRWITQYVGFLVSVYASRQVGMYIEFKSGDLIGLLFN